MLGRRKFIEGIGKLCGVLGIAFLFGFKEQPVVEPDILMKTSPNQNGTFGISESFIYRNGRAWRLDANLNKIEEIDRSDIPERIRKWLPPQ